MSKILLPNYEREHIRAPFQKILFLDIFGSCSSPSRWLMDEVLDLEYQTSKISRDNVSYHKLDNPNQFLEYIESLIGTTPNGKGLILHIDGHGGISKNGRAYIVVGGHKLPWPTISKVLSKLYAHTRGKVMLAMSTCWGLGAIELLGHSFEAFFEEGSNAPYTYLVGSESKINNQEANKFWKSFYRSIILGDPVECFTNTSFFASTSTGWLYEIFSSSKFELDFYERQAKAIENTGVFLKQDDIKTRAQNILRKRVYSYLLIDKFTELRSTLDLRDLANYLNDSDLLIDSGGFEPI